MGIDIDDDALGICLKNVEEIEIENADFIQMDITNLDPADVKWNNICDTVIMNPPFGTKHNKGNFSSTNYFTSISFWEKKRPVFF